MSTKTQQVRGAIAMYPKKTYLRYREDKPQVYKLQVQRGGIIRDRDITAYAAQAAHVPESTIALAQEALFDAINYFCINGHTVQVPGLGAFGIQLRSKVTRDEEDATAEVIKNKYIRYWAKDSLRAMCNRKNITITLTDPLELLKKEEP